MIDSLLITLPGLIWGASFLFIAEGLDAVSPSGVAFIRILVGFLTLSLVPAVRRPVRRADRARTAVLGVIWMAFPLNMFAFAEQHVSSALAGMLNGAVPLFVAAVAGGIARRVPARPILLGLAVGFLGAILIALPGMTQSDGRAGQTLGVSLILAALVSYGFAYSLSGPLQQRNGALPVIWRALGVAVVLTAPLGIPALLAGHWSLRPIASLIALGAGGTGIAYVMTATAAGRMGATVASVNNFIIPVVALALGVGLRHEHVSWVTIAGAGICLFGAWLTRRGRTSHSLVYTRAVKSMLMVAAILIGAPTSALAQAAEKITVMLDARTEGRATPDAAAARLLAGVRRGLEAIGDVEVVEPEHARRTIWIVTGATPGSSAASVIVTERYDRETLMVLGVEDDDIANRMMALQIVVDHQIFTGRDPAALAKRIVTAVDDGIFTRLRTLKPRP